MQTLSLFDLETLGNDQYRFWWGYRNVTISGGLLLVLGAKLMQTVQEHRQQAQREALRQGQHNVDPQDERDRTGMDPGIGHGSGSAEPGSTDHR